MTLPPLPLHPEKYYNFTEAEKKTIEAYGQQCAQAALEQAAKEVRAPLSYGEIRDCAWGYFEDSSNLPEWVVPFVRAIEAAVRAKP